VHSFIFDILYIGMVLYLDSFCI